VVDTDITGDWEGRVTITRGMWVPFAAPGDPNPEQPIDVSMNMGFVDLAMSFTDGKSGALSGYFGQTSGVCTSSDPEDIPYSCFSDSDCDFGQSCSKIKRAFLFTIDGDGDGASEPLALDTSRSHLNYIFITVITQPTLLSISEIPNPHPQGTGGMVNPFGHDLTREVSMEGFVMNKDQITGTYKESLITPSGNLVITGDFNLNRYYPK